MAAGRPVVAFAVDGVRDALGDTGVVLELDDVAGMTRALVDLLGDPALASAAGRTARRRVEVVGDLRTGLARWDAVLTRLHRPEVAPQRHSAEVDRLRLSLGSTALLPRGEER
jgi:glycosyltransferase involved in cell wall biosynthesis